MKVREITSLLEAKAPLSLAEEFDNVGLLVGDAESEVTGVLVTLDTLEEVVQEAIAKDCNLIVSFHPILFKGLKKITGDTYVERVITQAIQHGIAIYSMHTALDNILEGVSGKMAEKLGLEQTKVLLPKSGSIKKLVTYVPQSHREALLEKLYKAGAGHLGNYSHCSFYTTGTGSYLPEAGASPAFGSMGKQEFAQEDQVHITYQATREKAVLNALFEHHPYEEVAFEITTLDNVYHHIGMGVVGELPEAMHASEMLEMVKDRFKCGCIRHTDLPETPLKRIALLGGSGAFAISAARAAGADIFITGDVKYHDFFRGEGKMVIADIGHYESEQFTKNLLAEYLSEKIPNFAISLSETKTNPINYF